MPKSNVKEYKYKQGRATLVVGYDESGRLFSRIERDGNVMAKNMYMRMPTAETLAKQGWERYE